jgi:hypothetical protein
VRFWWEIGIFPAIMGMTWVNTLWQLKIAMENFPLIETTSN